MQFLLRVLILNLVRVSISDNPVIDEDCQFWCHSYHSDINSFDESRRKCKSQGGDLVFIETKREWKSINKRIQADNLTTNDGDNEWYIGLKKRTGAWEFEWLNGKNFTYDVWQKDEPSNFTGEHYGVIAKYYRNEYGKYNNIRKHTEKGRICEYPKEICQLRKKTSPTESVAKQSCVCNDSQEAGVEMPATISYLSMFAMVSGIFTIFCSAIFLVCLEIKH